MKIRLFTQGGRINLVRILLLQIGGYFDYPHLLNDI